MQTEIDGKLAKEALESVSSIQVTEETYLLSTVIL
jgi:hypothetical protein